MVKDMLYGLLVLIIGAVVMYGVYLSLASSIEGELELSSPTTADSPAIPSSAPGCGAGEELPCTIPEGCSGKQVCFNGEWNECIAPFPSCAPDSTRGCAFTHDDGACGFGTQACNACGTEWSECS